MSKGRPLVLLAFLALPLPAQLAGVVTPAAAQVGDTITLDLTAESVPVTLNSGCVVSRVRSGSPAGPVAWAPPICPAINVVVQPCSGVSFNLTLSPPLPPDAYWFEVEYFLQPGGVLISEFFPFTVQAAQTEPVLTALSPAQLGQPLVLQVDAPLAPQALYLAAASLDTNTGVPLGARHLALDPDLLFQITFPFPPAPVFTGLQGILDASGHGGPITLQIPNDPALLCRGLTWQAAIFPGGGVIELTNPLSFIIQ